MQASNVIPFERRTDVLEDVTFDIGKIAGALRMLRDLAECDEGQSTGDRHMHMVHGDDFRDMMAVLVRQTEASRSQLEELVPLFIADKREKGAAK